MIDVDKLEKLSCLKLPLSDKKNVITSLEGVMQMMHAIDKIELPVLNTMPVMLTQLDNDSVCDSQDLVSKSDSPTGLHLVDGYFMAPKVIQK